MVEHTFLPVFDGNSRVLILGSFPSVKSRAQGFYYGHPQNRFWRVLAAVTGEAVPDDVEGRKRFLLDHHIALWDVLARCDITGSSDASIRNAEPNDVAMILKNAPIRAVFVNGKTAKTYYDRFLRDRLGVEAVCLPSTSPANAAWSLDRLAGAWRAITE